MKLIVKPDLTWSKIIHFPHVEAAPFDKKTGTKAVEVTINDKSIFAPNPTTHQTGFRRAELLPESNNGTDPSTSGVKTLHFSVRIDNFRPLNYSHEYQLVFLETNDFSSNQFVLKTGTIVGDPAKRRSPQHLVLQSNVRFLATTRDLHVVRFTPNVWHNYGVVLDFDRNTTQVYYSRQFDTLHPVTLVEPNDVSGQGQYHFGLLKKPTGDNLTDITTQGYQESGINEGIIFGGIFEEDSSNGCISVKP
ncbi:hypothetical protein B7463_g2393, partial [Scytalidium lignicola]